MVDKSAKLINQVARVVEWFNQNTRSSLFIAQILLKFSDFHSFGFVRLFVYLFIILVCIHRGIFLTINVLEMCFWAKSSGIKSVLIRFDSDFRHFLGLYVISIVCTITKFTKTINILCIDSCRLLFKDKLVVFTHVSISLPRNFKCENAIFVEKKGGRN